MTIDNLDNFLDLTAFSSEELETQISGYNLSFLQYRNYKIEWEEKLPLFVPAFYDCIKKGGIVPTQNDYWLFYVSENMEELKSKNYKQEEKEGIKGRVYRTYPSLVRDLHFGLYLKEKKYFNSVFYNVTLDIEYGIDLAVETRKGTKIGFNLFTQTKAAEYARFLKSYRPKKPVGFACYEIPLDFNNCKKCGDFFLYSEREISAFINAVNDCMDGKNTLE